MANIPSDLRYTEEHEYVRKAKDGNAEIGITDYAQGELGDVVYVELPKVGDSVTVTVKDIDPKQKRISLTMKQVEDDPWFEATTRFPVGKTLTAKVERLKPFGAIVELLQSQTLLIEFLRTVKPYVDTRDFADVLRAIADENLKRSDALLARDRRRELQLTDVEAELTAIRTRLDELQRTLAS